MAATFKERYATSPRAAANARIHTAIVDTIGETWAEAFDACLVTRGKRIELLSRTTPQDVAAAVAWHAYEDACCEIEAGRFGFFPRRSYGGTVSALLRASWKDVGGASAAYDAIQTAIKTEYQRKQRAKS